MISFPLRKTRASSRLPRISNTITGSTPDLENGRKRQSNWKRPKLSRKPRGYPYVAAWLDTDEDLIVFKRFGELKLRILLTQQADIEALDHQLKELDKEEEERADSKGQISQNTTWIEDKSKERRSLIRNLSNRIRRYEKDILLFRQMLQLPKAEKWQRSNYQNMIDAKGPFHKQESTFLDDLQDLVALNKDRDDSLELIGWFSDKLDSALGLFGRIFLRKKPPSAFEGERGVVVTSKRKMKFVSRICFAFIVSGTILAGVLGLNYSSTDNKRIGVLCGSTVGFAILTSILTKAKNSEVFAVAAAYAAVLVVFVGGTLNREATSVDLQFQNGTINGTFTPV